MSRTNSDSPLSRNATFCSLHYDTSLTIYDAKLSSHYRFARFKTDLLTRANALREAILIRDGIFALCNANHLSLNELNYLTELLTLYFN